MMTYRDTSDSDTNASIGNYFADSSSEAIYLHE